MAAPDLQADELEAMKQRRLNFLRACCTQFKEVMEKLPNRATRRHEPVLCADGWLYDIIRRHFENVDHIRSELLDTTHLIDRHKVASSLLYHIMDSRPICYDNEQLERDDTAKRLLNARFALYVAMQLLQKWHKAYDRKFFVTTSRVSKFITENSKWLAGSPAVPVQFMAQTLYLLEQLCVVEGEYAKYSCVNDDAESGCNRTKQSVVPEYIVPVPPVPPV